jgi:hypothetical protein
MTADTIITRAQWVHCGLCSLRSPRRGPMNSHEFFAGKVSSLGCLGPYQICCRKALRSICRSFRKRIEIQYRTVKAEGLRNYQQPRRSV